MRGDRVCMGTNRTARPKGCVNGAQRPDLEGLSGVPSCERSRFVPCMKEKKEGGGGASAGWAIKTGLVTVSDLPSYPDAVVREDPYPCAATAQHIAAETADTRWQV